MEPRDVIKELRAMHRKVLREMPHVNCRVEGNIKCSCYKRYLLGAIKDSIADLQQGGVPDAEIPLGG